jgi:hypothetical protein
LVRFSEIYAKSTITINYYVVQYYVVDS